MVTQDWLDQIVPEIENEYRMCPDCSRPWLLTKRTATWFLAKQLNIPRRCEPCRAARRQKEAV